MVKRSSSEEWQSGGEKALRQAAISFSNGGNLIRRFPKKGAVYFSGKRPKKTVVGARGRYTIEREGRCRHDISVKKAILGRRASAAYLREIDLG